jgi:hypothetical protein
VSDAPFLLLHDPYPNKGQMEKTMFASFSAKSIMQATIQRLSGLDGWKDSIAITERSFSTGKRGTYMTEMRMHI